ncbi:hypothetical protein BsWGS_01017 [Bradybaena similaris]
MAKQEQMEEEFLTCNICFDVFKEPKTLACLHRFCQKCLHNYIIGLSTEATHRRRGFPCPVCREFILAPNPGKHPSEWASLLKTDFHLKNLIKYVESRKDCPPTKQLSVIEHPCSRHKNKDCELYCVDCSRIVCHLCAGTEHRACNQVLTLTEAASERRASLSGALRQVSEKLEKSLAVQKFHGQCMVELGKKKSTIEDEIKKRGQFLHLLVTKEENRLLEQLNEKYESLEDKIALKVSKFEEHVETMKNKIKMASLKNSSASDFELLLDDCVDETIKDFQDIDVVNAQVYKRFFTNLLCINITFYKQNISAIPMGDVVFSCNNKDSLDENARGTSIVANPSIVGDPSIVAVPSNNGAKLSAAQQGQPISGKPMSKRAVQPSRIPPLPKLPKPVPKLSEATRLEQGGSTSTRPLVAKAGSFSEARSRVHSLDRAAIDDGTTSKPSIPDKEAEVQQKVVLLRTINTRFREEATEPSLRDLIVVVPSNTVIVTDWGNQCVKAFHVRRERDSRLALGGRPWAITQMTEVLAAVSLPLSTQICVVKIHPTLTVHTSFVSAKKYSGLATLNSSMLVASGGSDPPSVDIINLYGEVLKSFTNDNNGQPLFKYPAYVNVSPSMLIQVSDRKRGAIFCISLNGETKFHFQPDGSRKLQEPSGLTSDLSGRIFIAESRGVLSMNPDGRLDKVLVRPQDAILCDPRGLALDSEGLLYVTSNNEDIKVLKI